jgi:plastocyanin
MSSLPLETEEIPEEAIRIGITTAEGFSPSSLEVKKGEEIVLSVTSQDERNHIFKFKDTSLAEVGVAVAPGETRAVTFYAPLEPGEYPFFCRIPGHEHRGEKGVMIVK